MVKSKSLKSSPKSKKDKSPNSNKSPKKGSDKTSKKTELSPEIILTDDEMRKIPITHVIFDLDGVLINSVTIFEAFINTILKKYDKFMPFQLLNKIHYFSLETSLTIIIKELMLPITQQELLDYFRDEYSVHLQNPDLLPGVAKIFDYFYRHKIPMAVVTLSDENDYKMKIERHKLLFNKMHHVVCYNSDPERDKCPPAPDLYKLAASKFTDCMPQQSYNILVFSQHWNCVDAALAANMRCIWVPDRRLDVSQHNFNVNLTVVSSLEQFQPQLLKLPYFNDLYTI